MNEAMPFAEQLLVQYGEFFPFARAFDREGQVLSIAAYVESERPPSNELIELLASGLRQGAAEGKYCTTALIYDVRVTPPSTSAMTDAVAAELEDHSGYAVTVYFPYTLEDGEPSFGAVFATPNSRAIFSR
ncbi:hypothetical protein [Novosphingobium sp.]|uniref:hypothetical protein n=1 Tax=Novosphingobium sp. TaxID=1874826 RepID=UPI0035B1E2CA